MNHVESSDWINVFRSYSLALRHVTDGLANQIISGESRDILRLKMLFINP